MSWASRDHNSTRITDIPHRPVRLHPSSHKSSAASCAAEHHNLQYYRNNRNRILFGEGNNSPSSKHFPLARSSSDTDQLGYGFNHWYSNDSNMSPVNGTRENGYEKVELRKKQPASRNDQQRPVSSGFQSFLKFFGKNSENRNSTASEPFGAEERNNNNTNYGKIRQRLRSTESPGNSSSSGGTDSSPTLLELDSTSELSSSSSTSCDSLFSIATTGFHFVPVDIYQPDGNTLKTHKQLPVQPVTDSYRKRLKQRESFREIDLLNDLTLRKKYRLFSTDTEPKKRSKNASSEADPSSSQQKPRRTVSDSSKDFKAGAYVHVKGKRKAPPPPQPNSEQSSTQVTPKSTYGRRKKRPAPAPPTTPEQNNTLSTTSLLDDKDIRAIIDGTRFNFDAPSTSLAEEKREQSQSMPKPSTSRELQVASPSKKLTEEQKQHLIESVVKATTPEKMENDEETPVPTPSSSMNNVPSFLMDENVLTMNKNAYKFCKPEKFQENETNLEVVEEDDRPISPLSPRPWYKRPSNSHKDYSLIPFKRETFLKTIDRKKNKNKLEDDLPEVPFCRNSLLENGNKLNFFAKLRDNRAEITTPGKQEKRRSGIGIPNISELDREAAEILGQKHMKPLEEGVNRQNSTENEHEQSPPRSAKELISKFEAQTNNSLGKVTVNPVFVGSSNGNTSANASPVMKTKHDEKNKSLKQNASNFDSVFKSWKCPYCTLENPSWKIVCLACDKLKPCDSVQKYFGPGQGPIRPQDGSMNKNDAKKDDWDKKREKVLKYFRPNASPKGSNTSLNESQSAKNDEKSTGNALQKSASETSMFGNEPAARMRKSSSPNRGMGSPALGLRRLVLERTREKSIEKQKIKDETGKVTQISITYAINETKPSTSENKENEYAQIEQKIDEKVEKNEPQEEISFSTDVFNAVSMGMKSVEEPKMTKKVENETFEAPKPIEKQKINSSNQSNVVRAPQQTSKDHLEIKYKDTVFARKEVFITNQAYVAPTASKESLNEEKLPDKPQKIKNFEEKEKPMSNQVTTKPPPVPVLPSESTQKVTSVPEKKELPQKIEETPKQPSESSDFEAKKRQLSNREELEREKARLREMIREMNAKALTDKYPVLKKKAALADEILKKSDEKRDDPPKDEIKPKEEPKIEQKSVETPPQQQKLGAIKKFFGNKVSSSVQTTGILKKTECDETIPITVTEISAPEVDDTKEDYVNMPPGSPTIARANISSKKEEEKVEKAKLRRQFRSHKGLESFKSSLNFPSKSMNRTNTLVINKLLRSLENAIADGEFDQAANYAMELAKMKVALSVTRQKDRPLSGAMGGDLELENIIVNMYVEDKETSKGPIQISICPLWSVTKLKEKIQEDFNLPVHKQRWIFFDKLADDDSKTLFDYRVVAQGVDIYLYLVDTVMQDEKKVKEEKINEIKTSLNKTIELQKALDSFEAEVAKSPAPRKKHFSPYADVKPKIERKKVVSTFTPTEKNILNVSDTEDEPKIVPKIEPKPVIAPLVDPHAWTCTLCTLINHHAGAECAACGHPRVNKTQEWPADIRKSEARRFLGNLFDPNTEINPVPKPQRGQIGSNNEKQTAGTSTSDAKNPPKGSSTTTTVMTALVNPLPNPNITKTKYRGVDNYNPNAPYVFPTVAEVLQSNVPIIKTVMLKNPDKFVDVDTPPAIPPLPAVMPKHEIRTNSNRRKKKLAPQPPGTLNRKSATYLELLNLDNAGIVPNVEPFECTICFVEYQEGEGVILRDCLHMFCKECLGYAIQYCEEPEVKCPYKDTEYSCEMSLQDREIRALVTPEMYEKHLAKSVRLAENQIENAFHCMTPNCRGWCIYEDNVNTFRCPVCRILNCLTCRAIHDGLNCKQYQERLQNNCDNNAEAKRTIGFLQEMVEKGEAMNCPTCQVIVMKKWGCDWLKCSICKTEICWITRGPRWGPGGKGDTSAGCKCGVNGKKCHEK
ncbi:uncharacterized protein LOC134832843 isoform X2 [Culicoides brevitarsis]